MTPAGGPGLQDCYRAAERRSHWDWCPDGWFGTRCLWLCHALHGHKAWHAERVATCCNILQQIYWTVSETLILVSKEAIWPKHRGLPGHAAACLQWVSSFLVIWDARCFASRNKRHALWITVTPTWHVNFPGLGFSMRVPGWRLKLQDCWCFMAALAAFFHVFSMDDLLFDFADQKTVPRLDPASESSDHWIATGSMLHGWRRAASLSSWRLPWPSWRRDVEKMVSTEKKKYEEIRAMTSAMRIEQNETSSEKFKRSSVVVLMPPGLRSGARCVVSMYWLAGWCWFHQRAAWQDTKGLKGYLSSMSTSDPRY